MNILHIVAGKDIRGGAAKGAYWLHQALKEQGVNSNFLVITADGSVQKYPVNSIFKGAAGRLYAQLKPKVGNLPVKLYRRRIKRIFSTGFVGLDFRKEEVYKKADIVHLHWINGFVSLNSLKKINKPVVWTLRDMWPFTGGCHYSMDCENYKSDCGSCHQLSSEKELDLSRIINLYKKKSLPKNLTLVGISEWVTAKAKESSTFKNHTAITIANNINVNDFFPLEKKLAKDIIGLPKSKKIILVGAQKVDDFYKGFDLFKDALTKIDNDEMHYVFFGNVQLSVIERLKVNYTFFGYIADTLSLRVIYSSADVFVAPSKMEAFGKTIIEAMSCETPVVCFDSSGPRDIVTHKIDGFKAVPFCSESLSEGIKFIVNNDSHEEICKNAREKVVKKFSDEVIAKKYEKLYKKLTKEIV